ncbi:A/G-specific DNA-adenine glycosylase [Nitzschia inconspicua]|uniref:Adenine DNA glycosylase n=1 Tax=Nitzschia inconspicua TaxID=303405 RepID=A0A9K3KGY7_9STRA|nr:A/G-specific DNA-adenine glycosylase [Nitzschia inconspicua]
MAPSSKRQLRSVSRLSTNGDESDNYIVNDAHEENLSPLINIPIKRKARSTESYRGVTGNDEESSLLQQWMQHSHSDYHNFTIQEAREIRSALLQWYQANRRKLPWRGDPPPFDGSTSGINGNSGSGSNKNNNKGNIKRGQKATTDSGDTTQKPITSFFNAKPSVVPSSKQIEQNNIDSDDHSSLQKQAIPVTGYGVWVSEIMLQQTRVEAVIPYWIRWMESFPTVHDLADATEEQVNAHWAGLGFYRRARMLHQGAKFVVNELDGNLPTTPEELSKLPGIGPYTAAAIASIAYNVCVPVVDGNVCRVLSRLTGIANHIKNPILKDKLGWKLAAQIVEAGDGSSPGLVNQALMELGATYCAPSGSGIDDRDPLKEYYLSTKLGRAVLTMKQQNNDHVAFSSPEDVSLSKECCQLCDPVGRLAVLQQLQDSITNNTSVEEAAKVGHSIFPTDPPKTDKREEDLAVAVLSIHHDDNRHNRRYLLVKRPSTGLLAGQWEFPNVCVQVQNGKGTDKDKTKASSTKPPTKASRKHALTTFLLDDIFGNYTNEDIVASVSKLSRKVEGEPTEHIFSHVRHLMWLESGQFPTCLGKNDPLEWTSISGNQVRWMNEDDMKQVGITSGVKKVLKVVSQKQNSTTNKRKR